VPPGQFNAEFRERLRQAFATQLPAFLVQQRWFQGKAREIASVSLADALPMPMKRTTALIAFARVNYAGGGDEMYVLPLLSRGDCTKRAESSACPLRIPNPGSPSEILLVDALAEQEFLTALLDSVQVDAVYSGDSGQIKAQSIGGLQRICSDLPDTRLPRLLKAEQSNTSIVYGDRLILKLFRRVEEGVHPDLEIGRFLTEVAHFPNTPATCGSLEYCAKEGQSAAFGIVQEFVPNRGDAWNSTTAFLRDFLVEAVYYGREDSLTVDRPMGSVSGVPLSKELQDLLAANLESIGLLGRRAAEMHLALSSATADPAFVPEAFTSEIRQILKASLHDLAVRNFDLLRDMAADLPESLRDSAAKALKLEEDVLLAFHSTLENHIGATRTRIHGDFHLGQVLVTEADFLIIDFEGEPAKSLAERRGKRSPLQDVAGMLRSFHYAARSGMLGAREALQSSAVLSPTLEIIAKGWQSLASQRFLEYYRETAGGAPFLPPGPREFDRLLRLHLLEKAIYELGYELNNRPAWLAIPLEGIEELLNDRPLIT